MPRKVVAFFGGAAWMLLAAASASARGRTSPSSVDRRRPAAALLPVWCTMPTARRFQEPAFSRLAPLRCLRWRAPTVRAGLP